MKKLFSENSDVIIGGRRTGDEMIVGYNGGGMKDIIIQARHNFEGLSRNGGGSFTATHLTLGGGAN
jgi:hypothetical protein